MNVAQLMKALSNYPDDYEVVGYEQGSVYETKVKALSIHPEDEDKGNKRVRIIHGN